VAVVVSLHQVVDELSSVVDEYSVYPNIRTGEFVGVGWDDMLAAESEEELDRYPEWQRQVILEAKEILGTTDYVALPSKFDIHEWEIMRNFCLSVEDPETSEDLLDAIHGSGAFRRF
jgi:hypothetical protein